MKLRYSPTSPFVRKVLVTAIETGTARRIDKNPTKTADPDLSHDNPLGKVPALVTDDGDKLYDSRVICEYLDSLHDGPALFPPAAFELIRDTSPINIPVLIVLLGGRPLNLLSFNWI